MRHFVKLLDKILATGTIVCLACMVLVVLLQVFARLFLPVVPSWTEEASRLFFIYTIGFAAGLAVKEKAYVNVDTFLLMLPERLRKLLEIFLNGLLLVFSTLLIYEAYYLVQAVKGQTSAALLWPMEIFYAGILLIVTFVTVYFLVGFLGSIKEIFPESNVAKEKGSEMA